MKNTFLIITSIANQEHPVLKQFAKESLEKKVPFIVIGDTKSPENFHLSGCDFYSIERQQSLKFQLAKILPFKHYARKNLGYLIAISQGAETIIETDDDNFPSDGFMSFSLFHWRYVDYSKKRFGFRKGANNFFGLDFPGTGFFHRHFYQFRDFFFLNYSSIVNITTGQV